MFFRQVYNIPAFFLSFLVSVFIPPWEAPDEPAHYSYVTNILNNFPFPAREYPFSFDMESILLTSYEVHQPPLYYLLTFFFTKVISSNWELPVVVNFGFPESPRRFITGNNMLTNISVYFPLYVARLLSCIIFFFTLQVFFRIGRTLFPGYRFSGTCTVFFFGVIPQVIFTFSTVNNDTLAIFLISYYFLQVLKLRQIEYPGNAAGIKLGILSGMCFLTKLNLLFIIPMTLVILYRHLRLKVIFYYLATVVITCGWWLFGNYVLYGDPTGIKYQTSVLQDCCGRLTTSNVGIFFEKTLFSFIGTFGWMNIQLPGIFYVPYIAQFLAGLIISLIFFISISSGFRGTAFRDKRFIISVILGGVCLIYGFIYFNLHVFQPQGRLLFPGLVFVSPLLYYSISRFRHHPYFQRGVYILILANILISILSLYRGIIVTYWIQ